MRKIHPFCLMTRLQPDTVTMKGLYFIQLIEGRRSIVDLMPSSSWLTLMGPHFMANRIVGTHKFDGLENLLVGF